jgi:hypothetical protein
MCSIPKLQAVFFMGIEQNKGKSESGLKLIEAAYK